MQTNQSTTPEDNEQSIKCVPTAREILSDLWDRSSRNLTKKELEWFASASQETEISLGALKDTLEGIGCLVASDKDTGNFQSQRDVSQLLFLIVQNLRAIEGLAYISDSAKDRLINPELYQKIDSL